MARNLAASEILCFISADLFLLASEIFILVSSDKTQPFLGLILPFMDSDIFFLDSSENFFPLFHEVFPLCDSDSFLRHSSEKGGRFLPFLVSDIFFLISSECFFPLGHAILSFSSKLLFDQPGQYGVQRCAYMPDFFLDRGQYGDVFLDGVEAIVVALKRLLVCFKRYVHGAILSQPDVDTVLKQNSKKHHCTSESADVRQNFFYDISFHIYLPRKPMMGTLLLDAVKFDVAGIARPLVSATSSYQQNEGLVTEAVSILEFAVPATC